MTEEEVEIVAEELAKVGGTTWYPGRERGPLLRVVSNRYRDRARIAIAALDRFRAQQQQTAPNGAALGGRIQSGPASSSSGDGIRLGSRVVYRPPGDERAYPCRIERIEDDRAYIVPDLRACTGWVSVAGLRPGTSAGDPSEEASGNGGSSQGLL